LCTISLISRYFRILHWATTLWYVRGIVDVFVQLTRRDGRRAVSQITFGER